MTRLLSDEFLRLPTVDASSKMRMTLRRSCAACAKAKHSCDLQTPKCSRCVKRNFLCIYANEPLTASAAQGGNNGGLPTASRNTPTHVPLVSISRSPLRSSDGSNTLSPSLDAPALLMLIGAPLDPFDSLPTTCVPRPRVQNLIYLCEQEYTSVILPFDSLGLTFNSPVQDRVSILSSRSRSGLKPVSHFMVASGIERSCFVQCIFANCVVGQRVPRQEGIFAVRGLDEGLCLLAETEDRGSNFGFPRRHYERCYYFGCYRGKYRKSFWSFQTLVHY